MREGIPDPRKRDAVAARYQVAADQHNDPTGAAAGEVGDRSGLMAQL